MTNERPYDILPLDRLTKEYLQTIAYDDYHDDRFGNETEESE